jgi:hypothetical protein
MMLQLLGSVLMATLEKMAAAIQKTGPRMPGKNATLLGMRMNMRKPISAALLRTITKVEIGQMMNRELPRNHPQRSLETTHQHFASSAETTLEHEATEV